MSVQYFYEVSSPSFQMVPHSPFIRKPYAIVSSPVAIVPDIDTGETLSLKKDASHIGKQTQLFTMEKSSPVATGRVPSISPKTPLNNITIQPREQQVPSQTPIGRKNNLSGKAPPLNLFSDDDCIFL